MASSINRVDVFVKDYLLFRGFANALKGLEIDLRSDKDKGFRPDLISEQLIVFAHNFELTRLVEYWSYLDRRMFSRLESQHQTSTRKLYSSLLKYYLVNSIQSGRSDKVQEFFERMTPELCGLSDWKDWFAIPYMKQPESVPGFEAFFSKQWQEALLLSLHNYVSVTMQCMPLPALVCMADLVGSVAVDERDGVQRRPANEVGGGSADWSRRRRAGSGSLAALKGSVELMDDFYNLTQTMAPLEEATTTSKASQSVKTNFMRPFRPQSSSPAAAKSSATRDKRKGLAPAASSGVSGGGISAAAAIAAAASGALQQAAAIVHGTTTAAAAAAATVTFGPGGVQLPAPRQPAAAAAVTSASGSSGGGPAAANDETDKKKPSFFEGLVRKNAADNTRVEFSADESRVQLPTVGASGTDGGVGGKQLPAALPSAAATDAAVRVQAAALHAAAADGSGRQTGVQPAVKRTSVASVAAGDDYSDLLGASPFHLLSQEEYAEHGSSAVTHCKFSKSGHAIVSADTSAVVKVWALNPAPVTLASVLAKSALVSLEWVDPADRLLLIGCAPDVIRLYDVKEKRTVMDKSTSNEMFINKLMAISVDPAGVKFACSSSQTIGSKDSGELMFWDLRTMEREQGLGDNVGITAMSYSRDGRLLIAGCADGSMRAVDITSGSCVRRWNAHNGRVCSLYVSNDSTSCYTVGYDSRLYEWSLVGSTCERLGAVSLHESAAGPFSWSSSASESIIGGGRSPNPPVVHQPKDRLFVLNSRETHLLSCGSRGGCIYRVSKEGLLERTMVLGGHRAPVVAVDWSGVDTETCLTADMAGKVRLSTLLSKDTGGAAQR